MNNASIVAVTIGVVLGIVAIVVGSVFGVNEAQRTGVERQTSCVEQGGSFVDLPAGQLCLVGGSVK